MTVEEGISFKNQICSLAYLLIYVGAQVCTSIPTTLGEFRGQLMEVSSLLSCKFQGLNARCQAWCQCLYQ